MTETAPNPRSTEFQIQIDRAKYLVTMREMTGAQLRQVTTPPIPPNRDLFEVVPGGQDRKIEDADVVEIHNGKRFFTAPGQINPGTRWFRTQGNPDDAASS